MLDTEKENAVPQLSLLVGGKEIEIPLQARAAAMVWLLARHQATINSQASGEVRLRFTQRDVELYHQPKLGRVKISK